MLTVVIPTLNAEKVLAGTLAALVPAVLSGLVRDVVIVDGGSSDGTETLAHAAGAMFVRAERGRGAQLAHGARHARGDWLMFLHADTVLESGWEQEVSGLIARIESGERTETAAAFRFALDDTGFLPRLLERMVDLRCFLFRLPYGDQGLIVSRRLYQQAGGYQPVRLMEDVGLVRRLGRRRIVMLRSRAVTNAARYRREGYIVRAARNVACLSLYYLRVPERYIVRLYG